MFFAQLSNYSIAPADIGTGKGLNRFNLMLSKGDVCSIHTDSPEDAHLLLKALTTLIYPVEGTYFFCGKKLDFSDYRKLLPIKKKIGYIAPDSAMISNRTLRENLLLSRSYHENSLGVSLDDKTQKLCELFNIEDKLDIITAKFGRLDLRAAITVRELTKNPEMLLLERPEDIVGHTNFDFFVDLMKEMLKLGMPIVFFSYNTKFITDVSNKSIIIQNGALIME